MDLNQLLYRQQVSLMRSDTATCCEARVAHRGLAKAYGRRITELQRVFATTEAIA